MNKQGDKTLSDEDRDALVYATYKIADATEDLHRSVKVLKNTLEKCCPHRGGIPRLQRRRRTSRRRVS
jgi:hypothetical protein